jgi:hypothetical protein
MHIYASRTRIGHGKQSGLVVLKDEVLVVEAPTVDRLTAATIAKGEVTSLYKSRAQGP